MGEVQKIIIMRNLKNNNDVAGRKTSVNNWSSVKRMQYAVAKYIYLHSIARTQAHCKAYSIFVLPRSCVEQTLK
jgi:hypothetical protein